MTDKTATPPDVKVVDRRWWARGDADNGAPEPSLKPSYVEDLERQLAEKDRALRDALAKYREAAAEFDHARARLRREISKDIERTRRTVLTEMLDVLDNLDRAIEAASGAAASPEALLQGIALVRDQFLARLEGFGVKRLDVVGQPFDPASQEAVTLVPATDPALDGVVAGIVTHGYAIGDEILRPATVAVAKVTIAPETGSA